MKNTIPSANKTMSVSQRSGFFILAGLLLLSAVFFFLPDHKISKKNTITHVLAAHDKTQQMYVPEEKPTGTMAIGLGSEESSISASTSKATNLFFIGVMVIISLVSLFILVATPMQMLLRHIFKRNKKKN